jgi:SnoaL-like protein
MTTLDSPSETASASSSSATENVPDTSLGRLYREHIRLILNKDIEGLLNQYAEDVILISSIQRVPRVYRGRDGLRQHFQDILSIQDMHVSIGFWGEVDDTLLMITEGIEMTTDGQASSMRFADNWVLQNGKIAVHFAGMVQHSDGSLA